MWPAWTNINFQPPELIRSCREHSRKTLSCGLSNGSGPNILQIYPSHKGEISEQVDAISQSSMSRDISDVWT